MLSVPLFPSIHAYSAPAAPLSPSSACASSPSTTSVFDPSSRICLFSIIVSVSFVIPLMSVPRATTSSSNANHAFFAVRSVFCPWKSIATVAYRSSTDDPPA